VLWDPTGVSISDCCDFYLPTRQRPLCSPMSFTIHEIKNNAAKVIKIIFFCSIRLMINFSPMRHSETQSFKTKVGLKNIMEKEERKSSLQPPKGVRFDNIFCFCTDLRLIKS
jgi:hypothetical protein